MKHVVIPIVFAMSVLAGCKDDNPASPGNRSPVISRVTIFPEVVGPSDSLVVVCSASDPDGDSLVYDWYSLSGDIVKIKGCNCMVLYNTHQNSQIFYAPDSMYVAFPQDTFGIECAVRDRKGGGDVSGLLRFIVTRTF